MLCNWCGTAVEPGARACPRCGHAPEDRPVPEGRPVPDDGLAATYQRAPEAAPVDGPPAPVMFAAEGVVEFLDDPSAAPTAPTAPAHDAPADDHAATVVERLLGGSWRPALSVAIPTVLVAGMMGALTAASQLLTGGPIARGPISEAAPRSTAAYFHGLLLEVAAAFGAREHASYGGPDVTSSGQRLTIVSVPLGVTLATVLAFAVLLRRAGVGATLAGRVATAVKAGAVIVAAFAVASLFAGQTLRVGTGDETSLVSESVSTWWLVLWAALVFAVVGAAVAVRPLQWWERRTGRLRRDEWYPAWVGGTVAAATAVGLGFVASVAAAFEHYDNRADTARLLPRAAGQLGNLGTAGWNVGLLGGYDVRTTRGRPSTHITLSLLDRHGVSLVYLVLLAIPVLSVAAGALAIRRYRGRVDARALGRCCYRLMPVVLLWQVLLGVAGTERIWAGQDAVRAGPQVLIGCGCIIGWYLVLGFAAGRVLVRRAGAPAGQAAWRVSAPDWSGWQPPPAAARPRKSARPAVVVAVVAVLLLAGGGVAAAVTHGGRDLRVVAGDDGGRTDGSGDDASGSGDSTGGGSTGDSSTALDEQARSTLEELAAAEQSFHDDADAYTDEVDDLDYVAPDEVDVEVDYADDTEFCATASAYESENFYTYDSEIGQVADGDNC